MSIFRAYDIRGVYDEELSDEMAEDIGRAFGTYAQGATIVVGRDCRLSSEALSKALIKGLVSAGCEVTDVGMVPTPVLYFSIHKYQTGGGIMITGSHNPPQYNGFKMVKGPLTLYGEEIQKLKKIIDSENYREGEGSTSQREILDDYASYIKERITVGRKLKVVVDAGNGVGGRIAEKIIGDLGCEVSCLYCEPDGNFPNHVADPTVDEYLTDLIQKVKEEGADIGIAYDGDADRVGFVDDKGGIIRGDQSLILFSREILSKQKNLKIIFEVKCSQALIEDIEEHGGIPIMYRTGHSFIKKKMREENSPLAGEMSGHFFFADNYLGYDDGVYASVRMIQLLSRSDKKLSEIIAGLPHYHSTPEIRVKCPDEEKFSIVAQVVEKFKQKYEVITVDGVRVQFNGGWGLVRASNTEPAIILRFEADTEEKLQEIKNIILSELRKYPPLNGI